MFICYFSDSPFGIIFIDVRNAFVFIRTKIGCGPSTEMFVRWTVGDGVRSICVRAGNRYFMAHRNAMKIEWLFLFSFFSLFSILFTCVCHQPDTNRENKWDKWYPTLTLLPLRNIKIIHVWSCDDLKSRPRDSIPFGGEWNLRIHRYFESAFRIM